MRKKYSDPLMFPAVFLASSGTITGSQEIVIGGGDGEWNDGDDGNGAKGLMMNSVPAQQASEPLTIVNPVEEAVTNTEVITEESSGEASSTASSTDSSPLEVETVIDQIVPDETASSGASE